MRKVHLSYIMTSVISHSISHKHVWLAVQTTMHWLIWSNNEMLMMNTQLSRIINLLSYMNIVVSWKSSLFLSSTRIRLDIIPCCYYKTPDFCILLVLLIFNFFFWRKIVSSLHLINSYIHCKVHLNVCLQTNGSAISQVPNFIKAIFKFGW